MSVLVVGMSHRSAPVSILEQLSMDDDAATAVASALLNRPSLTESMIISTCNRVEIYCVTHSFHCGVDQVVDVLHEYSDVSIDDLRTHLYVRYADAAAEHLFTVACGLDSMVLGEQQIIGQVRHAYQRAAEQNTAGSALHALAQAALHTGKRVHTETTIDDAGLSMVSFALSEAARARPAVAQGAAPAEQCSQSPQPQSQVACPHDSSSLVDAALPFAGSTALVFGAGAMSSLAATQLGKLGVASLLIANRTLERAEVLAEHAREAGVNAQAIAFDDRVTHLDKVDIVVSATGAHDFTLRAGDIPADHKGLVCVDLSMPRDIEDAVGQVDHCTLINIETLTASAPSETTAVHDRAMEILHGELSRFTSQQRVKAVAPAVSALRRHAEELVEAEMLQLERRTPAMLERERAEVNRTVHRIVEKLLHQPTVAVKEMAARSGTISYESALQELFGLPEAEQGRSVRVNVSQLPYSFATVPCSADSVAQTYTQPSSKE